MKKPGSNVQISIIEKGENAVGNKTCFHIRWLILMLTIFPFILLQCTPKETQDMEEMPEIVMDQLSNAASYYQGHPDFERAFAFLKSPVLETLDPGPHEIDGDRMFCLIMKGEGLPKDEAKLEAHRNMIDIHYIISGVDGIGWKPTAECNQIGEPYDEERDIVFYSDEPTGWITVPSGSFAIFYPGEAHAPMVGEEPIHKAVVKVALE